MGLRTGDTSPSERQKQLTKPPHILLTTPESLCVLLSQAKWLPALATVRWIVVDEIHALAESKRGVTPSLSLERLDELAAANPSGVVTGTAKSRRLHGSGSRRQSRRSKKSRITSWGLMRIARL